MLNPSFLGLTAKATDWKNQHTQNVYSDFICDFIETFICKYLKGSDRESIPFYDTIKLVNNWRVSLPVYSTSTLTELADEQVLEKALHHLLGSHFLPNNVKKRKSMFFDYDDEEKIITLTENQPFRFQLLPAEDRTSDTSQLLSGELIPKEMREKLKCKMVNGNKEAYLSESFFPSAISWWNSLLLHQKELAREIIDKFGCVARFIVLLQDPSERENYQTALLKWIFNKINRQIFIDRSMEIDIFSVNYLLTRNIPFLFDYDFIHLGLLRKKFLTLDHQANFYLIPAEGNFSSVTVLVKPNPKKPLRGWSSDSSIRSKKSMKKTKSDALHTILGGFSINKRNCK